MSPSELLEIIQSDFKLWENSETEVVGDTIKKTIHLPHGIGEFSISFGGITNATGRRNAAAMWGESIREEVDNAIGDEAVTARAAQRAAYSSEDDGAHGGPSEPNQDVPKGEAILDEEAIQALGKPTTFSTDPSCRLDELRAARDGHKEAASALDLEIKALTAYMEVMNADTKTDAPAED